MKKFILFISLIAFYFTPALSTDVFAATIEASLSKNPVHVDDSVYLELNIDTEKESINAVAGSIKINGVLTIEGISTVDSIINLWIDNPKIEGSSVKWSGLIPGGFNGVMSPFYKGIKPGLVLKVAIKPTKEGRVAVSFDEIDVRLNDGAGTQLNVISKNLYFDVLPKVSSSPSKIPKETLITDSAESFSATVSRNELVADNKWFVVFKDDTSRATVDHYEVAESSSENKDYIPDDLWKRVDSPYVLSDQTRDSFIFVKSVRVSGDSPVIVIKPSVGVTLLSSHAIAWWGIIIVISSFLIRKFFFKKAQ